jgi:hypothetical protein
MPTHQLTCGGPAEVVHDTEPRYRLALDWSCDGLDLGKVAASLASLDLDVGDERFFAAMAVEIAHALEIDVLNGEAREVWSSEAWPVVVGAQAVARRAQAPHAIPPLVVGAVVYTFVV